MMAAGGGGGASAWTRRADRAERRTPSNERSVCPAEGEEDLRGSRAEEEEGGGGGRDGSCEEAEACSKTEAGPCACCLMAARPPERIAEAAVLLCCCFHDEKNAEELAAGGEAAPCRGCRPVGLNVPEAALRIAAEAGRDANSEGGSPHVPECPNAATVGCYYHCCRGGAGNAVAGGGDAGPNGEEAPSYRSSREVEGGRRNSDDGPIGSDWAH